MVSAARHTRLIRASGVLAVILATLVLVAACTNSLQGPGTTPSKRVTSTRSATGAPSTTAPSTTAPPSTAPLGTADTYQVGTSWQKFDEPAHTGPTGYVGERKLMIMIQYPLAQGSASQPASGPFPLLLFAPGYQYCGTTYVHLLDTWASAGYVVAAVNFPLTDCQAGSAQYEPDIVNQPADMSYVRRTLLSLSAQPGNVLSGLLNPSQVAAVGHSDGGDTVAALAANICCTDTRLKAVAVLSGSEWPTGWPGTGKYFSHGAPPMMFVQGNADTVNPPSASLTLYKSDWANARYYVNLFGADHMTPYAGSNSTEQLVAHLTLDFFNRYVLGQTGALTTMTRDGNDSRIAALVSGGHSPHDAG